MAKMFYTTEEAAQKLGVTTDALKQLVTQNKLREFRDGARVMFKVDQVDRIAGEGGTPLAVARNSQVLGVIHLGAARREGGGADRVDLVAR